MKSVFYITLLLISLGGCKSFKKVETFQTVGTIKTIGPPPKTILMDGKVLQNSKNLFIYNDSTVVPAFTQFLKEARLAKFQGPFSVTDKDKLPPSGDKHDYASYSRYWWPDTTKADGLPYIRRDGVTNPSSQSLKKSDRPRIGALGKNVETLGLAYYFTGHRVYALKAAQLLRVWFLDSATRMNPNVNHAQCRPGHNLGSKSGILDGRLLTRALEGSLLIASSNALSKTEQQGLKDWAGEYFEWLTTNKMALQEAQSKNNHGSYYDAQTIYFALYAGKQEAAKRLAQNFIQNRLTKQIMEDGSMPQEMARTRPLFYSIYNLHAMCLVAHLAQQVDVDIWRAKNAHLQKAFDHLLPYTDATKKWPSPTLGEMNRMELFAIVQMAHNAYPSANYNRYAEQLPLAKRKMERSNLAFPLMR